MSTGALRAASAVLMGLAMACGGRTAGPSTAPEPASSPEAAGDVVIETIEETTVGDLDGVRVPMGNMTTGTYTLPDGSEAHGVICSLALPGETGVFVGMGSEVEVEGTRWRVVDIDKPKGKPGSVSLEKLD